MQARRHRVSGLCLEAAAIREGRGVAQVAAKMEAVSGQERRPATSTNSCKQTGKQTRVQRRTDRSCCLHQRNTVCEANSRIFTLTPVCTNPPPACASSSKQSMNSPHNPSAAPTTHAPSSHKRPLRTQSPPPIRTKRPALAPLQESAGGGSSTGNAERLLGCVAAGWPGSVAGAGTGGGRPHSLVVRHVGTGDDITPAWQQAIAESAVKARHDEDAENRATDLSRKMEQLGKEAAARVSRENYLKILEKDIVAHDASKCAERLTTLSRARRARLQLSMDIGGSSKVQVFGPRILQQVDNERVCRSVYCRAGAKQDTGDQGKPGGQRHETGTGLRLPLGELEPGFFGNTGT